MMAVWESYYQRIRGRLAGMGLQHSSDPAKAAELPRVTSLNRYNLDTALHLHCGAAAFVIESPAHSFSTSKRDGQPFRHTVDQLVDAQLTVHEEGMKQLLETGGVARWMAPRR